MRYIAFWVLFGLALPVYANPTFYGEARVGAGGVRHSDLDFYPRFGSFSAGVFVRPNIGIEVFADTSLSDADRDIYTMDVTQATGVAARFQAPPQRGLSAYILLGYVDFTLEQRENGIVGPRTVKQSFDGLRFSIGVQQELAQLKGLLFGVEYKNYHADSGITVDGLSVGLRVELR